MTLLTYKSHKLNHFQWGAISKLQQSDRWPQFQPFNEDEKQLWGLLRAIFIKGTLQTVRIAPRYSFYKCHIIIWIRWSPPHFRAHHISHLPPQLSPWSLREEIANNPWSFRVKIVSKEIFCVVFEERNYWRIMNFSHARAIKIHFHPPSVSGWVRGNASLRCPIWLCQIHYFLGCLSIEQSIRPNNGTAFNSIELDLGMMSSFTISRESILSWCRSHITQLTTKLNAFVKHAVMMMLCISLSSARRELWQFTIRARGRSSDAV